MDINKIRFIPATNAVADVYTKATGMPFVGEMMVAAAGQESEPTPDPDPEPTQLIMDEDYENYIGDICEGGNWTAHTSYNGTDFQDQSGTYETPDGCPADCNNWEDMGYGSYEDCDCNENGNCDEEEPEE